MKIRFGPLGLWAIIANRGPKPRNKLGEIGEETQKKGEAAKPIHFGRYGYLSSKIGEGGGCHPMTVNCGSRTMDFSGTSIEKRNPPGI